MVLIKVKMRGRPRTHDGTVTGCPGETIVSSRRRCLLHFVLLVIAGVICAQPASAQDATRGRELYETHCGDCHYQRVHERDRAKSQVQTLDELRAQVVRWSVQTRTTFSAQDRVDMVEYLNRSHYRLEK